MSALHVMQAVNWKRFDLEEWLKQFGYWLKKPDYLAAKVQVSSNSAMIAGLMGRAAFASDVPRLQTSMLPKAIVNYILDENPVRLRASQNLCLIDDIEAKAVERLILDSKGQSEILDDWLNAVVDKYFKGYSWPKMVTPNRSLMDARSDVKCGLAALHARYPFIKFKLDKKSA